LNQNIKYMWLPVGRRALPSKSVDGNMKLWYNQNEVLSMFMNTNQDL